MARKFVIRITHGTGDVERAAVGLTVAATAVTSGISVDLWLMNDAVELATPGVIEDMTLEHAPPIIDLWKQIENGGGTIYACTQCMMRRNIAADGLRDGVEQAGAPMLVASIAEDGVQQLAF